MRQAALDLVGAYGLQRGFVWNFTFRRLQPSRQPVDLTGLSARLEIFSTQRATETPVAVLESGPLGADGRVVFGMTGDETRALPTSAARYRIIFADGAGNRAVFLRGRLAVLEECQ
jgi:hypothetical protein